MLVERRLVSPDGYLVVTDAIHLTEPVALPPGIGMVVGSHRKMISLQVTSVVVNSELDEATAVKFYLPRVGMIVLAKLTRTGEFMAPISGFAHRLEVRCLDAATRRDVSCNASLLLLLTAPSPEHAVQIFRATAWAKNTPRWMPSVIKTKLSPELAQSLSKKALDFLSHQKTYSLLWTLTKDLSAEVRGEACKLDIYSSCPGDVKKGNLTTAAALALRLISHVTPRVPCSALPPEFECAVHHDE